MLAGTRCVVCQALPYTTEAQQTVLIRQQDELINRMITAGLERDLEHHSTLDELDQARQRITELEDTVRRQNVRLTERKRAS